VRQRPGQTEAGVEFARPAGAQPVAMIGEVVHDDGSMMRFDAVRDFADDNGLVMVSIEQLIAYLDERDAAAGAEARTNGAGNGAATSSGPSAAATAAPADAPAGDQSLLSTEEVPLPTEHGSLRARAFTIDGHDHLGVFAGSLDPDSAGPAPLVRVHSECLTGDVFG